MADATGAAVTPGLAAALLPVIGQAMADVDMHERLVHTHTEGLSEHYEHFTLAVQLTPPPPTPAEEDTLALLDPMEPLPPAPAPHFVGGASVLQGDERVALAVLKDGGRVVLLMRQDYFDALTGAGACHADAVYFGDAALSMDNRGLLRVLLDPVMQHLHVTYIMPQTMPAAPRAPILPAGGGENGGGERGEPPLELVGSAGPIHD